MGGWFVKRALVVALALLHRDIAFFLLAVIGFVAVAGLIFFDITGLYARIYAMTEGVDQILMHWSLIVVPLASIPAALLGDRELSPIWRQVKMWVVGTPLIAYIGYWVFTALSIVLGTHGWFML